MNPSILDPVDTTKAFLKEMFCHSVINTDLGSGSPTHVYIYTPISRPQRVNREESWYTTKIIWIFILSSGQGIFHKKITTSGKLPYSIWKDIYHIEIDM